MYMTPGQIICWLYGGFSLKYNVFHSFPYLPEALCLGLSPHDIAAFCVSLDICVILFKVMFSKTCWWDIMSLASLTTKSHRSPWFSGSYNLFSFFFCLSIWFLAMVSLKDLENRLYGCWETTNMHAITFSFSFFIHQLTKTLVALFIGYHEYYHNDYDSIHCLWYSDTTPCSYTPRNRFNAT